MIGMPNQPHAVKINKYSSLLIRVESGLSVVRWLPLRE